MSEASPGSEDAAAGIPNFRDAGGMSTSAGTLRTGVVYRSSHLVRLDVTEGDALLALGVTDVFDLRTTAEIELRPDLLPEGLRWTGADVLADRPEGGAVAVGTLARSRMDATAVAAINAFVGEGRARTLMLETYRDFVGLESARRGFEKVLRGVADAEGASIVHCTAGKDRAGWAIALVQLTAGADPEHVTADYLRSNEAMHVAYGPLLGQFATAGGDAESLARILYVEPDYLDAGLSAMRRAFGDLEGYLDAGLGMNRVAVEKLRARLRA